ncbi:MAG: hypothetical protein ACE5PV_26770 [Candidatus Poribacteria bacterium]
MKIFCFNWNPSQLTFEAALRQAVRSLTLEREFVDLQNTDWQPLDLTELEVFVGHGANRAHAPNFAFEDWWMTDDQNLQHLRNGAIFLKVSSEPLSFRVEKWTSATGTVRYFFAVRDTRGCGLVGSDDAVQQWIQLLTLITTPGVPEEIIAGLYRDSFLWTAIGPGLTLLVALKILCEGYLAAHGGDNLDGWDKLPEVLQRQANTPEKQNLIRKPCWWMNAFRQFPNWENNLMNETKELAKQEGSESEEITAAIANLVEKFKIDGNSPAIDATDSQIVHKAYDACKSLLGGGR